MTAIRTTIPKKAFNVDMGYEKGGGWGGE